MTPRRLVGRLVAAQRGLLAGLAVLVLLGVVLAVAAPRALGAAADAAVRSGVARAGVAERTLTVQWVPLYRYYRGEPVDDAALSGTGGYLQQAMRPTLAGVLDPMTWGAQSSPYEVRLDSGARPDPESHQFVVLRAQQEGMERVTWVHGRAPEADAAATVLDGRPTPVFEVAFAAAVAEGLSVEVGDRLVTAGSSVEGPLVMDVVGTFVPDDSIVWETEPLTVRPNVDATRDVVEITGAALVAPDDVGRLDGSVADSLSRTWVAPFRAELLDTDRVVTVLDDVGALRTAIGGTYGDGSFVASTRLGDLASELRERSDAVARIWWVGAVALIAVAGAALWFAADLLRRRQHGTFALLRARGARKATVGGIVWSEVALVVVPVALLGAGVSWLAVASRSVTDPLLGAVAVVAVGVLLPGIMAWSAHRDRRREDRGRVRWRVVVEALLVLGAVGSWWLVRDAGGSRPVLSALVPTLLALVAGVLLLHLVVLARRVARRAGAGRRGVVATVALAQDEGGGPRPVVVVLVAAVATTALASCVLASVAAAQERGAYEQVGAQTRVESRTPAVGAALAAAGGCGVAAGQARFDALLEDGSGRRPATVLLLAVPAYLDVVAGTPLDPSALAALTDPGGEGGARPILVPAGIAAPDTVQLGGKVVPVRAVGTTPPWLRAGAVVPLVAASDGWPVPVDPDRWYVCGAVDDRAVDRLDAGAVVVSAPQELSELRGRPLVPVATAGVVLAAALALALALACLVMAEAARRPERLRDATLLRTLGSSARERRGVALLAGLPAVLAAVLVGLGVGVGLGLLVLRTSGLTALSGGTDPTLVVPWGVLAVVAVVAAGLTVGSVVLGTARDERAVLAAQLKGGDRS